jgi:hypothetical protein
MCAYLDSKVHGIPCTHFFFPHSGTHVNLFDELYVHYISASLYTLVCASFCVDPMCPSCIIHVDILNVHTYAYTHISNRSLTRGPPLFPKIHTHAYVCICMYVRVKQICISNMHVIVTCSDINSRSLQVGAATHDSSLSSNLTYGVSSSSASSSPLRGSGSRPHM